MRRTAWLLLILLGVGGVAEAQQSWDLGVTVGTLGSAPMTPPSSYDDWYFTGRYGASIGRFWTDHIKTEIEFAGSGEGSRYATRIVNVPGVPPNYEIGSQEYYRLHQVTARFVYQFFDNAWVHPYVFGGGGVDFERRRSEIHEQYFYASNGPNVPVTRVLVTRAMSIGPEMHWRPTAVVGTGAKLYMTPRSYFNAAAITSFSDSTRTISFVAGFGVTF